MMSIHVSLTTTIKLHFNWGIMIDMSSDILHKHLCDSSFVQVKSFLMEIWRRSGRFDCSVCRRFAVLTHYIDRFIDLNLRGVFLFRVCAIWGFKRSVVVLFSISALVSGRLQVYFNPFISGEFRCTLLLPLWCSQSSDPPLQVSPLDFQKG